ncbi:MAG: glycosyltransferase [Actinomycetota bacterium]|nr:glycosyltransferase [Actinomycetota bacterium]
MRGVREIVVTDGGSTDGTLELVVSSAARLVRAARPGGQLKAGATAASGDVLLFLHADVAPPPDAAL